MTTRTGSIERTQSPLAPSLLARVSRRMAGCAVLAMVWLLALANAAPCAAGSEILVLLSRKQKTFSEVAEAVKKEASGKVRIVELDRRTVSLNQVFWSVKRGKCKGVVAIGGKACKLARENVPESMALVLCTYGTALEKPVTGRWIHIPIAASLADQIPVIKRLLPKKRKVAILHRNEAIGPASVKRLEAREDRGGVKARCFHIRTNKELGAKLTQALRWADLLWIPPDREMMNTSVLRFILSQSLRARKPILTFPASLVKAGALAGLVFVPASAGTKAAMWIDAAGTDPGAREKSAADTELWINGKVARFLKVTVPKKVEGFTLKLTP